MNHEQRKFARRIWNVFSAAGFSLLLTGALWGQVQNAGLQYIQNITIPNWTTTGSSQANFDLFAFNPATRIMYVADRTNHSVDAIDTRTNTFVGMFVIPSGGNTNGVVIAPDLQQLAVTDGKNNVYVYDLRLPGGMGPDTYVIPGITSGTDALDYDPLNHTVYVINGSAPYFMTGIDLVQKAVTTQLKLPGSPELMRFNPVDGLIYQVITDGDNKNAGAGVVVFDPVTNSLKATYPTAPNCVGHGIEIDATTNTAIVGCGGSQAQILINLKDGKVLNSFPDVTGTDLAGYNPNNRRFYVAASGNKSTTTGCAADTGKNYSVIGVFDARGSAASPGQLLGVTCAGRNAHGLGVDTIQNNLYVGSRQYPSDPNDSNTGVVGIQVYNDPAPPAQFPTGRSQAVLTSAGGNGADGVVEFVPQGRSIRVDASIQSIGGTSSLLNIATTVGNETIPCTLNSGSGTCSGVLLGDPLVGGPVLLASDGSPVAHGTILSRSRK